MPENDKNNQDDKNQIRGNLDTLSSDNDKKNFDKIQI